LKRLIWWLPVLALAAGCGGREELKTPEAVLGKVGQTYRSLRSYEDRSTETVDAEAAGEKQHRTVEHRFAYQPPNRFYHDIVMDGQRVRALASDGQKAKSLLDPQHMLMADAPPQMAGSGELLDKLRAGGPRELFLILMGQDPFEGLAPRLVEGEDVDGQAMYVLEVSQAGQPGPVTTTYWIGKDDFLIHQRRRMERQEQGGPGPVTIQITETRRDLKVNQPLAPTTFALDTPPGAQVREIHNPLGQPVPALAGKDLNGKPVSLASLKGKVVLLNFWAFW
jgi:outer membrane lipoprotein-sorting protein